MDYSGVRADAYQLLGIAFVDAGDTSSAIAAFDNDLGFAMFNGEHDLSSVNWLLHAHRWVAAFERLKYLVFDSNGFDRVSMNPAAVDADSTSIQRALDLDVRGDYQDAYVQFSAIAQGDTFQEPHYFLGITALALHHWDRARDELELTVRSHDPVPPGGGFFSPWTQAAMDLLKGLL
jgi:hypothetical protein